MNRADVKRRVSRVSLFVPYNTLADADLNVRLRKASLYILTRSEPCRWLIVWLRAPPRSCCGIALLAQREQASESSFECMRCRLLDSAFLRKLSEPSAAPAWLRPPANADGQGLHHECRQRALTTEGEIELAIFGMTNRTPPSARRATIMGRRLCNLRRLANQTRRVRTQTNHERTQGETFTATEHDDLL